MSAVLPARSARGPDESRRHGGRPTHSRGLSLIAKTARWGSDAAAENRRIAGVCATSLKLINAALERERD